MTKLRALIAAGIVLGTTTLATLPASASTCYYELYWDGWGNYSYAWICY